jgi:catechol 2,3-dioxygenase-like lactoylglutathione lyase family enzyme
MKNPIIGFQHIGIPVVDLEASISFYSKLGFTLIHRTQTNDSISVQVAFLKLDSFMIEIYQIKKTAMTSGAIDHFAMNVVNIDRLFDDLQEKSFQILDHSIQDLPFWENGIRYFRIKGPNAEIIEFCEYVKKA